MVKRSTTVPATPMKSSGARDGDSSSPPDTPRMATIAERSVSFEDDAAYDLDTKEDDKDADDYDDQEEKAAVPEMATPDTPEGAMVATTRSGGVKSLARNLVDELDEVAGPEPTYPDDDGDDDVSKLPRNTEKGRYEAAVYGDDDDGGNELAWPVNLTSTRQFAENTVSLLMAMGCEAQAYPTEAALRDWSPSEAGTDLQKWKKKLRMAFGATNSSAGRHPVARQAGDIIDPSQIPLPQTPKKGTGSSAREKQADATFAASAERSPYFQDSHMVTPRSASRTARLSRENDHSRPTRSTQHGSSRHPGWRLSGRDDSSDDDDDLSGFIGDGDDLAAEFARQIQEASCMDDTNATPTIELATHRPLAQIKPFHGCRGKQENSVQWLRAFVYEMKGTRTPTTRWCEPFQLSLRDGALHWFNQLPKKVQRNWQSLNSEFISYYCSQFNESAKTRYYSAQRTDTKEHICYYLNRLNGYTRNAGVRFANGGREGRDHVRRFLKTCSDKSLQTRLGHLQVSDIHELEGMINEILKMEGRYTPSDTPSSSQRSRDPSRGRDNYRRRDERRDDRRSDGQRDGVTLAEASLSDIISELQVRESRDVRTECPSVQHYGYSDEESDHESERDYDEQDNGDYYSDDEEERHLAAANDNDRRAAADGIHGRKDNRPPKRDRQERDNGREGRFASRERRDGNRQYGPCAACGGLNHSAHYCFRRCKLCKQVHDAGKCEAFQELANLVKVKVDKTDLSPELQGLLAELEVEAECIYAFVGKCEWPDHDGNCDGNRVNSTDFEKKRGANLGGGELGDKESGLISSVMQRSGGERRLAKTVRLLPGERLGWWSSKKFDRRVRMRALVEGAVNDSRTKILLDTGANVSVISTKLARRLRVRDVPDHGRYMEVQGFTQGKQGTSRRALVKITLGWERVYEFELWVMDHSAGVEVVLGTDFMIPAGVRLDLFHAAAQLPDEIKIPLIKTKNMEGDEGYGTHVTGAPTEDLYIPAREWAEFRLQKRQPSPETHVLWIKRDKAWVPTVTRTRRGRPDYVRITNVTVKHVWYSSHRPVVQWVPFGDLPREAGYVRLDSKKYTEWQVIAYAESREPALLEKGCKLYEDWLSKQPPAVEKPDYVAPTEVQKRPIDEFAHRRDNRLTCAGLWERVLRENGERGETMVDGENDGEILDTSADDTPEPVPADFSRTLSAQTPPTRGARPGVNERYTDVSTTSSSDGTAEDGDKNKPYPRGDSEDPVSVLERTYISVAQVLTTEGSEPTGNGDDDAVEHEPNVVELEDYAQELAFLPDFTEISVTELAYSAPIVQNVALETVQQKSLVDVLKNHERIMISSGNALPQPAYGVVCDINVNGHAPIKQRARRVPLRHLRKLYELTKGLLMAGLIAFSDSPWASPIVTVMKKNGQDIRLCIDYKMVNAITAIMEYAMPLVDDLLTDLESYLWFCSLDAASGFWAIMMTLRARKISAFVCALGHFESLRMPFGLKNAPMIYQRMIDNALWGFVHPKGGWKNYAKLMQEAEEQSKQLRSTSGEVSPDLATSKTKFDADREASVTLDPVTQLINSPIADMFVSGEPDESTLVSVFERRSFVDDICFGGETFDSCLATLDRLLSCFAECRISDSFKKSIFVQSRVDFLSHEVSPAGIRADPKKMGAITELPFPTTKKGMQSFL
ncbi:hypothetical protein F441_05568, partial [Phytophthora nicotianae CJ01A1]